MADDHRSNVHPLRTALAAQGVHLSALFFAVFENTVLPGTPQRRPRLMAPPGPSTSGGRMARQNLSLVPDGESEGAVVVVGWADAAAKRAELRSWRVVSETYRRRFGQELDIPVSAYNAFMRKVVSFLHEQDIFIDMVEHHPDEAPKAAEGNTQGAWLLWALVMVATLAAGIGLGVLIMTLNR